MKPLKKEEILGTADVAAELGVTPDWIRNLVRQQKLSSLRTRGGRNLFLLRDIVRLKRLREEGRKGSA